MTEGTQAKDSEKKSPAETESSDKGSQEKASGNDQESSGSNGGSNSGRYQNNKRRNQNRNNKRGRNRGRNTPRDLPVEDNSEEDIPTVPKKNRIYLTTFQGMPIHDLKDQAESLGLEGNSGFTRQEMILFILKNTSSEPGTVYAEGVLEVLPDGYGFLRSVNYNYSPSVDDVYIFPSQIRRYRLRTGHILSGPIKIPTPSDKYFSLGRVDTVNGEEPDKVRNTVSFDDLVPIHPNERFMLEHDPKNLSTRIMDLVTPVGKGQRGLLVAPPFTGKTVLLKDIATSIMTNHQDVKLIVLLVDERPEEVTEFRRHVSQKGEVVASTFDEPTSRHVAIAEMVLQKSRRWVEFGQDVVILLDSITRLGRAYNSEVPHSGKILSGGMDASALQRPKRFFGAARCIEGGGSLTIIGTALIDTGSKMDEVIYEEFKGTGNMQLHLDRRPMNKRMFPAFDVQLSSTRKEELLLDKEELAVIYSLRQVLSDMNIFESLELLTSRMKKTQNNAEFLMQLAKQYNVQLRG